MTSQGEWHATLDFSVKNYEHLKTVHEVTSDFIGGLSEAPFVSL